MRAAYVVVSCPTCREPRYQSAQPLDLDRLPDRLSPLTFAPVAPSVPPPPQSGRAICHVCHGPLQFHVMDPRTARIDQGESSSDSPEEASPEEVPVGTPPGGSPPPVSTVELFRAEAGERVLGIQSVGSSLSPVLLLLTSRRVLLVGR